jgi:multisubunit Na+/H+ antiporter MnhG subunit
MSPRICVGAFMVSRGPSLAVEGSVVLMFLSPVSLQALCKATAKSKIKPKAMIESLEDGLFFFIECILIRFRGEKYF